MSHYFKEDQPHVFTMFDKEEIEKKYEEFMEKIRGEIENWSIARIRMGNRSYRVSIHQCGEI